VRRVLVIANEGEKNPSTRMRILQYLPELEQRGYSFETIFMRDDATDGHAGVSRRLVHAVRKSDVVFVQRVLKRTVNGILRHSRIPVIFDLDDAVHYIRQAQYEAAQGASLSGRLKLGYRQLARGNSYFSSRKRLLDDMLEFAAQVIVGNRWLCDDLSTKRPNLIVLPTAVCVDRTAINRHDGEWPVTIGWTGISSNLFHLDLIAESLRELGTRYGSQILLSVVSSVPYRSDLLQTEFVSWSVETETAALNRFDVGIMPLQDDPFSRGKCSFKAVLCMSRALPVVVSPVGANRELVEHGVNGFLARDSDEWTHYLAALVENPNLRSELGANALATVERSFSRSIVLDKLDEVLQTCV
jgi:glycosyltransferase involved in cell wall biosynthesis